MVRLFRWAGINYRIMRLGLDPRGLAPMHACLRSVRPDILVTHGKPTGLWGRLAARRVRVPAVVMVHGLHYAYRQPISSVYLALERHLARHTAAIIHLSESQRLEALSLGIRSARDVVIPNGVDVEALRKEALTRANARRVLNLPAGQIVLGAVARLDPVKQTDVLVEMMIHLSEAHRLVVVGDGAERARLERVVIECRIGHNVQFVGELANAARLLLAFDLFVTASAKEGCPLALLEAMALGLPVVASDISAHREILGLSPQLAPGQPAPMAEQVRWLLRTGPALRERLGAQNVVTVREQFSLEAMVAAHRKLYEEVA